MSGMPAYEKVRKVDKLGWWKSGVSFPKFVLKCL